MSTVNLYDVLNLDNDCSRKEIKDSYRKLVREYHPDRPGGDVEMFELVTHAYNMLVNPKSRAEYDNLYRLSKQSESDHFSLKSQADNFFKAQKTDVTVKKSKDELKKEFEKGFDELDRKHGYNRKLEKKTLGTQDLSKLYQDRMMAIEQEDTENLHEKLFDHGRFDINRFNAAFDAMHSGPLDMIPHSGNPTAYNTADGLASNFVGVDKLDDLYVEDDNNFTSDYGSVNFDTGKKRKLTAKDVAKLKGADYVKGHNNIDTDYSKMLEERMSERLNDKTFDDRTFDDFDTDPNCGGYGIFQDVGINNINTLHWDDDEDIQKRYQRLLELRKKDN